MSESRLQEMGPANKVIYGSKILVPEYSTQSRNAPQTVQIALLKHEIEKQSCFWEIFQFSRHFFGKKEPPKVKYGYFC